MGCQISSAINISRHRVKCICADHFYYVFQSQSQCRHISVPNVITSMVGTASSVPPTTRDPVRTTFGSAIAPLTLSSNRSAGAQVALVSLSPKTNVASTTKTHSRGRRAVMGLEKS